MPEADDLESVIYLTIEDVLGLYAAIIGGSATQATNQLRSRPSLESAIGRPAAHAHYERADFAAQAADSRRASPRASRSSTATSAWRSSRC